MTQLGEPIPVVPLQYDNTRPDTLVRFVRLFCYGQIVTAALGLVRVGLQLGGSGGSLRAGYPAGAALTIAQIGVYVIGPVATNALVMIAGLLGLRFSPSALVWARVYCVAGWITQVLYLVVVPLATWSFYSSRSAAGSPSIVYFIGTSFITGAVGLVFPTVLYFAIRMPAVRDLFRPAAGNPS